MALEGMRLLRYLLRLFLYFRDARGRWVPIDVFSTFAGGVLTYAFFGILVILMLRIAWVDGWREVRAGRRTHRRNMWWVLCGILVNATWQIHHAYPYGSRPFIATTIASLLSVVLWGASMFWALWPTRHDP